MAARRKTKTPKTARSGRATADVRLVDAVHQIWLAGMGALARAQKEGPRAFESMIVEGASFIDRSREQAESTLRDAIATVQTVVEDRVKGTTGQAADTWDNLEKLFQGRVQKVLQQVGVPTAREINALMRRVDDLNASVIALGQGRKSTARKPAGRRKTATKSRRTAKSGGSAGAGTGAGA